MTRPSAVYALLVALGLVGAGQPAQPEKQPAKQPEIPTGHPQIPLPTVGDAWPKARSEDVASIDALMAAFYAVPAGEPGQARDWDRYRSLFVPDARLIPARTGPGGSSAALFLSVSDYLEANRTYFEKGGFSDREVGRRVEAFGNIVHVWSTYESRRRAGDADPYSRGINSLQVLKDGGRYWIVNVFWDHERAENPIPERYLERPQP